jgi:hypothetical protein
MIHKDNNTWNHGSKCEKKSMRIRPSTVEKNYP